MNALELSIGLIALGLISAAFSSLFLNAISRNKASITRISLSKHFNLFMALLLSLNFGMVMGFGLQIFYPNSPADEIVTAIYIAVADAFSLYNYLIVRKKF
jgi:hypothetical protein